MKRIYFAHPIKKYHTKEEADIIRQVHAKYPKHSIYNPANEKVSVPHINCRQCMQEIMKPIFFKHIAKCDKFLLWDAIGSCGVNCELHEAWRLNKEVMIVDYIITFTEAGLQTYHYAHYR